MWNLLRDWLLLNSALRGPEDTRQRCAPSPAPPPLRACSAIDRIPLALRVVWWGIVVFCAGVAGSAAWQGEASAALGGAVVIGLLVALRVASRLVRRPAA